MKLRLVCAWLLVTGAVARADGPPDSLEGTWRGTLGEGDHKLRVVLTMIRTPDGLYRVALDSIDQNATVTVDTVVIKDASVRLGVSQVGGTYEGTLNADRSEMKGTWTQGGVGHPLSFTRGKLEGPAERAPAARAPAGKPLDAPLDVTVPLAPSVLRADDKLHLVYELHVTNMSRRDVVLVRVEALDGARWLARVEAAELIPQVARPGAPEAAGPDRLAIAPGTRTVVFMWLAVDGGGAAPKTLDHRITVRIGDDPLEWMVAAPRVAVRDEGLVVAAPLRGGDWLATNGPSNTSGHRRALIPVGGRAVIAQRFAIDWQRVGGDGSMFTGDRTQNRSYRAYGAEALAVADGTVTATKDGIPENVPGATRAVSITLETVGGNHVIVDLGRGCYAFYAHLQPGSLRVKAGDRVKRGQVLGLVGNSGNSTAPHLHFHVSDASSPLGAEGVPYAFEAFEARAPGKHKPFKAYSKQLPTDLEVVRFP